MSEIELKVGQVWSGGNGGKYIKEILKISGEKCYYFFSYLSEEGCEDSCIDVFINHNTLITNADGTPHVKPNDYRAGDVWEYNNGDTKEAILITLAYGDLIRYSSRRLVKTNLLHTEPNLYRLIYRDGKVVTNG